jgi:radical SAM superfamily enzyme YgiQ (UPF0313 family)
MEIKNILLLLAPEETSLSLKKNIPPLSLGILQSYLQENDFNVQMKDLNINLSNSAQKIPRSSWLSLFDTEFVFRNLSEDNYDEMEKLIGFLLNGIDFNEIDFVGISIGGSFSLFEIHLAFLLGKLIKLKYKKTVVFGGTNIIYFYLFKETYLDLWNQVLKNFKYIFKGPAEIPFVQLLKDINEGKGDVGYMDLSGAIYNKNGEIIANDDHVPSFSCPDFSGLDLSYYSTCINVNNHKENEKFFYKWAFPYNIIASKVNRYRLPINLQKEVNFMPYYFNFNCPYKCAFCEQSYERKTAPCSKKAETVLEDLKNMMLTYSSRYFYFYNNTFNFTASFVKEFCNLVIEQKVEFYWSDCARVNGLTREMLALMYKAGCRKLIFGFETASQKLLKYVDKRLDLTQVKKVLKWCKEIGIWADLEVIVGFPYEYEEDFQATYKFIIENVNDINSFNLNKYFVVPMSLLGTYPEKYNIELIRIQDYNKILHKNKLMFESDRLVDDESWETNFHIYAFNETNGRPSSQILEESKEKVQRMYKLLKALPTFKEFTRFMSVLQPSES